MILIWCEFIIIPQDVIFSHFILLHFLSNHIYKHIYTSVLTVTTCHYQCHNILIYEIWVDCSLFTPLLGYTWNILYLLLFIELFIKLCKFLFKAILLVITCGSVKTKQKTLQIISSSTDHNSYRYFMTYYLFLSISIDWYSETVFNDLIVKSFI